MHWVIQNNLYREVGHARLLDTLDRFDIPYTEIDMVPCSQGLPLAERIRPLPTLDGPVMACGSVNFAQVARQAGWLPGSFYNENHDYQVWRQCYGHHLLNADARVCRFSEVEPLSEELFFIRPCGDTKAFSGQTMDYVEFVDWRHRVIDRKETYTSLNADTLVMYGPLKTIYREARFFVVDGRVVTYSTYKIGDRFWPSAEVPPTMIEFAERMVELWQPARAFVLDVALTDDAEDGFNKIVEINCLNSAGFYEIDLQKFVMAIEAMIF